MPGPYLLGRNKPSARRLAALAAFAPMAAQLPGPPAAEDFTAGGKAFAGTMGNTTAGDCTIAGVGHLIQGWSAMNGGSIAVSDEEAIAVYSQLEGYDPASGQPDDGMVETDVLDHWVHEGLFGNKLTSYTAIAPRNTDHIKQAIWCFGGVYLGCELPQYAVERTDGGQPWTLEPWYWLRPIAGGHCVVSQKYDANYLYVDTWGQLQPVAWDFVSYYFDVAYAVLNPLWLGPDGKSPGGLDLAGLSSDLPAVAN